MFEVIFKPQYFSYEETKTISYDSGQMALFFPRYENIS